MRLNRNELRKIMYDFNSRANRLLQSDFDDYNDVLSKFMRYVDETEIIHDYIESCGQCTFDMESEFKQVASEHAIFELGNTDIEEVRNVYSILKYIVACKIPVHYSIGMPYSRSRNYQEILKDFNDRVTMVFIRHIENYLTKVGIDMGMDERTTYNISVRDGQVNIANDNSNIIAMNSLQAIDQNKLDELIKMIRQHEKDDVLCNDDVDVIEGSLDLITSEVSSEKPRRQFLKSATTALKGIKGTVEFGAAVAALIQFLQPFIG